MLVETRGVKCLLVWRVREMVFVVVCRGGGGVLLELHVVESAELFFLFLFLQRARGGV